MIRLRSFLFASVFLVASGFTLAQAETVVCTAITSLPYTITTPGVYCVTGNLNTNISAGSAITINANNVVLDLNGFKIGGLAAGKGTEATGIYAFQRQNITIKNGTVRGFYCGMHFNDDSPYTISQGHVIEDIRADQNTMIGLAISGKGCTTRNNAVVATGGTTIVGADSGVIGIVIQGPGARVLNNDVTDVAASGDYMGVGIVLRNASNSVVANNRVSNITALGPISYGIGLVNGCSDVLVSDNRISGVQNGIYFDTGNTGKYMNNLTMGVTNPYTGGTPAGTTNY